MLMLIWNNIARRRTRSVITVTITTLTIFVFVMVMGIFQVVTEGLELSRERLGADALLVPKYASATGSDLLFTALPENIYMDAEVLEQAKRLEGVEAMTPQFYNQTLDSSCCDTGTERHIVGYDSETDVILTHHLVIEDQAPLKADEVIMGSNYSAESIGQNYFLLSPAVWNGSMAALCGGTGVVLAVVLGFASAMVPAMKSAAMDPQSAITQGEVN